MHMVDAAPSLPPINEEQLEPTFDWFGRAMRMRPNSYGYFKTEGDDFWTEPRKPLAESRVALLSTGGVYRKGQPPFDIRTEADGGPPVPDWLKAQGFPDAGDWSYRVIPSDTPSSDLKAIHGKYNTGPANQDINCIFPIDRLRELAERGFIGGVAPRHIGMMGFIPDYNRVLEETGPAVADLFRADAVDVVVLSPG